MAEGIELKGSRKGWTQNKVRRGRQIWASDDAATDVPAVGDFFTPPGGTIESGLTGRRCTEVTVEEEVLPGVYYHVATFEAFVER